METDFEGTYMAERIAFGRRFKTFRTEKKLVQTDFDVRQGKDNSDISKIENGPKNIEFTTIVKLSIGLKEPMWKLFTDIRVTSDATDLMNQLQEMNDKLIRVQAENVELNKEVKRLRGLSKKQ